MVSLGVVGMVRGEVVGFADGDGIINRVVIPLGWRDDWMVILLYYGSFWRS